MKINRLLSMGLALLLVYLIIRLSWLSPTHRLLLIVLLAVSIHGRLIWDYEMQPLSTG
jgi:hypothetical protein